MNLAVARGRACLFTRVSAVGLEQIAGRLSGQLGLTHEHATQWLTHVGLEQPVEQLEGDPATIAEARRALEEGLTSIVDDLRLSLDYYGAQEGAEPASRVVVSGAGCAIPGLVRRMQDEPRPAGRRVGALGARRVRAGNRSPTHPLLRPGAGGLDAPGQPDPARVRRGQTRRCAAGRCRTSRSAPSSPCCSASPRWS